MSQLLLPGAAAGRAPSELVLPGSVGNRRNTGGLTIHVPRGYEQDDPRIVGVCHFCDAVFTEKGEEDAWQKHTVKCGQRNLEEIRAMSPREQKRGTIFDDETSDSPWDPEVHEHLKGVGKKMLAEGRMVMLPSERAGFS